VGSLTRPSPAPRRRQLATLAVREGIPSAASRDRQKGAETAAETAAGKAAETGVEAAEAAQAAAGAEAAADAPYALGSKLGQGAFATCYACCVQGSAAPLAAKVVVRGRWVWIGGRSVPGDVAVESLRREARALRRVGEHAHVVELRGLRSEPEREVLLMSLAPGGDLAKVALDCPSGMPADTVRHLLRGLLAALARPAAGEGRVEPAAGAETSSSFSSAGAHPRERRHPPRRQAREPAARSLRRAAPLRLRRAAPPPSLRPPRAFPELSPQASCSSPTLGTRHSSRHEADALHHAPAPTRTPPLPPRTSRPARTAVEAPIN